jgi:MFS family permease
MVGEQIEKLASARDKEVGIRTAAGISDASQKAEAGKPPEQAFDVAKFAGIFAAIGLAVGALGTAIAAVVTGFLGLVWWQMPLAIVGLILAISGPSMVIAYLKLRQRNLAPILDANGWAVNARAKINIPFGTSLTAIAKLPPGAQRSLQDPFAGKKRPWRLYLVLVALVLAAVVLWQKGVFEQWWGHAPPHEAVKTGEDPGKSTLPNNP